MRPEVVIMLAAALITGVLTATVRDRSLARVLLVLSLALTIGALAIDFLEL